MIFVGVDDHYPISQPETRREPKNPNEPIQIMRTYWCYCCGGGGGEGASKSKCFILLSYRSVQLARLAVIICLENSTTFKCDFYIRTGIMEFAFKQQSRKVPLKIH